MRKTSLINKNKKGDGVIFKMMTKSPGSHHLWDWGDVNMWKGFRAVSGPGSNDQIALKLIPSCLPIYDSDVTRRTQVLARHVEFLDSWFKHKHDDWYEESLVVWHTRKLFFLSFFFVFLKHYTTHTIHSLRQHNQARPSLETDWSSANWTTKKKGLSPLFSLRPAFFFRRKKVGGSSWCVDGCEPCCESVRVSLTHRHPPPPAGGLRPPPRTNYAAQVEKPLLLHRYQRYNIAWHISC